jgi:predicted ATPase
MLIEFKVSNFRSIREEQTFSLVASNTDKDLPECVIDRELPGLSGVKFLKGAAIFGANASGKSNILAAIKYVADFVGQSATNIQPGDNTGAEPFKLDKVSVAKPSEFELTFVAGEVRFVFGFAATSQRVVEEYLVAYPKGAPQRWYYRAFNEATEKYEWAKPSTAFKQDKSLQAKTRENALFISVGPQFNHPQLTQVYNWFKNSIHIMSMGAENRMRIGYNATMEHIKSPTQRDRIINLLRSADFGVDDARVQETEHAIEDLGKKFPPPVQSEMERMEKKYGPILATRLKITLTHKADGIEPVALDFDKEESEGTRRFFGLIGPWLNILDKGYTVFLDEIETSLHPVLVKELLRLVFSSQHNPKGAQVVFTTQNPLLLDNMLIRRDQVWFTEKSPGVETYLYPLTDFQPRKDEALERGYLGGRYGAIPFFPEGLKL